jgi:PKD repeat protein
MSENCYLLLELEFDPPVEDQAVIDQKIEEKRKFWSRNSTDFKRGAEYKRCLEMLPKIKEIMSDPIKCKKEADSACSIVYDPIDKVIKEHSIDGNIDEDIVENYANVKKISFNVVKKRIFALGVKIIPMVYYQTAYNEYYKNKPENAATFDDRQAYLKALNKDNFYDFLNPGTIQNMDKLSCDKLKQLAQEKKTNEFYKNDAYSSSGKKICEACELAFKDKSSKTTYDEYLVWCKRRRILDDAKESAKITGGNLSYEQGKDCIGKLIELLKDRKLAEKIYIAFCKIEKIAYNPDSLKGDNWKKEAEEKRTEAEYKKRQDEARREEARREEARREEARREEARREEARREEARREEARQEAARQEAARRKKRKTLAIIALCLLIFCVVALRNTTDLKDSQSTPSGVSQAPIDTIVSNVNDTNSKDTTNVIKKTELSVANFRSDTTSGEAPLNVEFTDESTESPASWKWDFGDGSTSTKQNPEHTYSTAGVYTVKETVTNEAGENTETKTDYVTVTDSLQVPAADFSVSETSGEAPLTVTFTDESSESPTEWKWDFGDGSTSTKKNPEHTYSTAGVYTVEETVTNEVDEDTETKTEYITVTAPLQIPAADFSVSETSGEAPLTVSFTDDSSGSPNTWQWNFGDSSDTLTKYNPTHTFTKAGTYTVTETVTNEAGKDTETKTNYITVTAPEGTDISSQSTETAIPDTASQSTVSAPVPDFSASVTSGEAPLTVTFIDESTGSSNEWKWNFGDGSPTIDGTTSAYKNPTHTYIKAGIYDVKETAINSAGKNTKTKSSYITVTAPESIDTASDNTWTGSDTSTTTDITSLPTKSEVSTFVNDYQGVSDFIETVSENSKLNHPEWKWDIWKDQSGNRVISFYYYQNNSKGYESIYFDSEGNTISKKGLELTPVYSYPGA